MIGIPGVEALHNSVRSLKYTIDRTARKMAGASYRCLVLEGEIPFTPIVNSNMAVSCCEHDYDHSCVLGDLRKTSLREIVDGPVVAAFRRELRRGRLPSRMCAFCHYRGPLPPAATDRQGGWTLKTFRIEPTRMCNLRCLNCCSHMCPAEIRRSALTRSDLEILSENINANGTSALILCGRGEPFCSDRFTELTGMIRKHAGNVRISSSTNGMLCTGERNVEAALMLDHLFFSIFGPDNRVHGIYHRGGNFDIAYANMAELVQHRDRRRLQRPIIEWKYVLFWWNDRKAHLAEAIRLAQAAGVDSLGFTPTNNPFWGISLRYRIDPYYRRLGVPGTIRNRRLIFSEKIDAHDIFAGLTPELP